MNLQPTSPVAPESSPESACETVDIYTDGACKGNPGVGGWGVLMKSGATEKELFGGRRLTTNNRMELMAVIQAFNTRETSSRKPQPRTTASAIRAPSGA